MGAKTCLPVIALDLSTLNYVRTKHAYNYFHLSKSRKVTRCFMSQWMAWPHTIMCMLKKNQSTLQLKYSSVLKKKKPKRHMNFGGCRGDQIRIGQHATMGGLLMGC